MALNNRYDFVLLFDVRDGNPNGDPDAGNLPRVDAETGRGLVTDVSLKRKVRNFVGLTKEEQPPFEIYVKEKAILNNQNKRAYMGIGKAELLEGDDKKRKGGDAVDEARQWMCKNFFDVRTFGAVMSTGINCGQVRGPVQLTFARSVDPIVAQEHSITRMAVATEAEAEKQGGDNRTMGRKFTVPYGLYVAHGFVSAHLANQTGFNEDDLELLWQSLVNMFEHDRSAARGEMATRGLYVFKHDSQLGNAPAYNLFERIQPKLKDGIVVPRSFEDYQVNVNETSLPSGVTLERKA
ncbi:MAG TPA: type I-C CRISPR-associated protein Cas7/Csd2 [Nitrosomonas sp.]|nr:type I-C CRISPR-associated protein Cas7/Csd2 [Nitrosomonas sp.]HNO53456.1 type I-C CRISPR-associated protein Cas7/Csd2 [Cyclobacteriaceae bacterium]HMW20873.1 type I-C CRISPR-associated protein Cas7/Csd2 [Nitrosomonas sp.]HMW68673.1 type I-C CRISPR-associated protein Cas7/Csd2 [Nitrosomonas sp.]HMY60736.1 type I-C CRISPR-associated protein Cas7/Csd2 [Nitrosomonas sp.]